MFLFETSNVCNLYHKECPLSLEKEIKFLPSSIIFSILEELSSMEFKGIIAFHTYSEPLSDPRLFKFIEKARSCCPSSDIYFSTNGKILNQLLLDELIQCGLTSINVSAYSDIEFDRLSKLNFKIKYSVSRTTLIKTHLQIYDLQPIDCKAPYHAPLREIIISRDGNILLCCRDWKRQNTFGNLYKQTLKEILNKGELLKVYNELINGNRFLDICKRCGSSR